MRNFKFLILSLPFLLLTLVQNATAQEQKIGYIDSDYILNKMPEYDGVQQTLKRLSQGWKDKIDEMDSEIEQLNKEFDAKEILYTDEVRKQKKQEIEAKKKQREQYLQDKFGSDGEYFQRQKELLEPIQRKIMNAVNTVAERNGFDYVFDRAGDFKFMYARQQWNISDDVLIELGIDPDQASN